MENSILSQLEFNHDLITDDEFDSLLNGILDQESPSHWCSVYPELYTILREELNNEVLSVWESRNPSLRLRPEEVIQCLPCPYLDEYPSPEFPSRIFLRGDILVIDVVFGEEIAVVLTADVNSDIHQELRTDAAGIISYDGIVRFATWEDIESLGSEYNESPAAIAMGLPRLPMRPAEDE